VADFVTRRIGKAMEPEDICEELMMRCLASDCSMGGLGCDNMTVVIVCFLHNEPYDRLTEKCKRITEERDAKREQESASDDEEDEEQSEGRTGDGDEGVTVGAKESKISKLDDPPVVPTATAAAVATD